MTKNFVNVVPVFNNDSEREFNHLKYVYHDSKQLISYIEKAVEGFLKKEDIEGKRIFLKPNWVRHDIKPDHDIWCLRTHDEFVLATVEYLLSKCPGSVVVGDAPIQSCKWHLTINNEFKDRILALSAKYNIPVSIKDYRRMVFDPQKNTLDGDRVSLDNYTIFDLGKDSFLEPISYGQVNPFRVTSYDPARLAIAHGPGYHKYCITHELFNSDIVISLPKIKTHQKTGITAALKNIVGLNGDKDFLPHHRKGGVKDGGDCYPGTNFFRRNAEHLLDFANSRKGRFSYLIAIRVASVLWKISIPTKRHQVAAGWYGNDTTWRMVLDLNKIALYGTKDGAIMSNIQRKFFSLSDGIIGGQGDGPLNPDPLNLGIISFTNHSGMHDVVCALLMRFDFRKINLLRTVFNLSKKDDVEYYINNIPCEIKDYNHLSIETIPPPGWVEHLAPDFSSQ